MIDWHFLNLGLGAIQPCSDIAYKKMCIEVPSNDVGAGDPAFMMEVDLRMVNGNLATMFRTGVHEQMLFAKTGSIALATESTRWQTRLFLRKAIVPQRLKTKLHVELLRYAISYGGKHLQQYGASSTCPS